MLHGAAKLPKISEWIIFRLKIHVIRIKCGSKKYSDLR